MAPEWPLNITLNAFLAFSTSLAKLAFLIPIVEGFGQLRWLWFAGRARRLSDFDLFDQASRGAYGGLRLLVSFKGGYVSHQAVGCVVSDTAVHVC